MHRNLERPYLMVHSFTEENYLKTIYKLLERGEKRVFTNALADQLATSAASVTDMLKKLSEKKLIHYEKYQGVNLTPSGKKTALNIVRKHRLWESFLVNKLNFTWDQVHEVAEQLEHIQSDLLIEQLDKFLNHPKFDPHGDPIPDKSGNFHVPKSKPLSELSVDQKGTVSGVDDHSSAFLKHLAKNGIELGKEVKILDRTEYDHSVTIQLTGEKQQRHLSYDVARNILITH